ncbi:TldD/PmbA family protein [bacterium]|nr:TldD/PmbA family protein [bacterium]
MLNKKKAFQILEQAIKKSSYKNVEVFLFGGKKHLTRFAENTIHQNIIQKNYVLTVKITDGKRVGIAKCNIFDGKNLAYVVEEAEKLMKHIRDDDMVVAPKSPEKGDYEENKDNYHKKTSLVTPAERAETVMEIVSMCKPKKMVAAGTVVSGDSMFAYMNSKKRFAYDKRTFGDFTITLTNETGGTSSESSSNNNFYEIDFIGLTKKALKRAEMNQNPIELKPGKYTVLLEEMAVTTLLDFLAIMGFGGLQYYEKRSFMKLGEKITGDNITVVDNPYNKLCFGLPFDFEGSNRRKITLIEKGVAKNVVHDHRTAKVMNTKTTGHALSPGSSLGPFPINLEMNAGKKSTSSILKSIDKGILITRFFYSNIVDRNKTTITGMTRDGTFLIENGKITKPILNMRFNENVLEALKRVDLISKERKVFLGYGGIESTIVPKLLIRNFNFTGVSKL